jgi:hypothetical protein
LFDIADRNRMDENDASLSDVFDDAAERRSPDPGSTVRPYYDEVDIVLLGRLEDLFGGDATGLDHRGVYPSDFAYDLAVLSASPPSDCWASRIWC